MNFTILKKVFCLWSSLSLLTFAYSLEEKILLKTLTQKNGDKKLYLDFNQDGKADTFQIFHTQQLVSQERDTEYSGVIDEWAAYFPYESETKAIEIRKRDTNKDGKIDRIESVYKNPTRNQLITTFEVDTSFNGKFDKVWTNISDLDQKKQDALGDCEKGITEDQLLEALSSNVQRVQGKLNDGFAMNELGYKVHQSCLERWGANTFNSLLTETMKKGFQCLRKLANENTSVNSKGPNGARSNLSGILTLLKSNNVSVVCGEKKFDWSNARGHASTEPSDLISNPKVQHPFISLDPSMPSSKTKPLDSEKNLLAQTLFHEQFHNLGLRHEESIEYPYTCEICCLPSPKNKQREIELSCKICSGAYSGHLDTSYLKDMIAWSKMVFVDKRGEAAIINFLKEQPRSRFGLFALAEATSSDISPTGIEIAKILGSKFPSRSDEENEFLQRSLSFEFFDHNKKAAPHARIVAEASIVLYYDHDPLSAMEYLERNKAKIKEMVAKKGKNDIEILVAKTLVRQMDSLLSSIWMNGYPKNDLPLNNRAYELMRLTGLLK